MEKFYLSVAIGTVSLLLSSVASAASIIIDGNSSGVSIPGTTANATLTAYSDALGNDPGSPSLFNNEVLNYPGMSDPNVVTGNTIQMSDVPIYTIGGQTYLRLIYDAQETNPAKQINITSLAIDVGSTTVWEYDPALTGDSIIINPDGSGGTTPATDLTIKPLGQGADLFLLISTSIFDGTGLTGSDDFVLSASQTFSDNGNDEWAFQGFSGEEGIISYTDPNALISQVPIPAAAWLFGSAMLGLVGVARRKKA